MANITVKANVDGTATAEGKDDNLIYFIPEDAYNNGANKEAWANFSDVTNADKFVGETVYPLKTSQYVFQTDENQYRHPVFVNATEVGILYCVPTASEDDNGGWVDVYRITASNTSTNGGSPKPTEDNNSEPTGETNPGD